MNGNFSPEIYEPTPATVNYRNLAGQSRTSLHALLDRSLNLGKEQVLKRDIDENEKKATKLGWRDGVLIPVLLNIWGVIMFLRIGWVVGQAGLILSTVIVLVSNLVTFLTALSLSAICTNGEIQTGGLYFLISRALGPVDGGTIGLLFYIAQSVAVSLHVVGFAESIVSLYALQGDEYAFTGNTINDTRIIGIVTCVCLLMVALIGIGWYAKTQMALLILLLVSIFSIIIGAFIPKLPDVDSNLVVGFAGFGKGVKNFLPNFQIDPQASITQIQDFFSVFAVFFPTVTGIMAGASLSGDLKDASTAIPKGTIGAILISGFSYLVLVWWIGLTCLPCTVDPAPGEAITFESVQCNFKLTPENVLEYENVPAGGLLYDRLIMRRVSLWEPLLYMGVFAATLSSALASMVGAPRILQVIAGDGVFPCSFIKVFAYGRGVQKEPVRGYFLTFIIACCCVSIGKLDVLAPIISNLFMISYALTNYACFYSSYTGAPNWRPSFKYYSRYTSGLGALICIVIMFLIDWIYALATVCFALAVWLYLNYLDPTNNWGEASSAAKYSSALQGLEKLQLSEQSHVKTFRPQFLVMTGDIFDRLWLVKFASLFQHGGGIMICADIVPKAEVYAEANIDLKEAKSQVSSMIKLYEDTQAAESPLKRAESGPRLKDIFSPEASETTPNGIVATETDQLLITNGNGATDNIASHSQWKKNRELEAQINADSARFLGAEVKIMAKRREQGDQLLANKIIWNRRKCKGAFYDVVTCSSLHSGFQKLLQLSGVGKLRPNAMIVGFKGSYRTSTLAEVADYERLLRSVLAANYGLLVVRDDDGVFDLNLKDAAKSFLPKFGVKIRADTDDSKNDALKATESQRADLDFAKGLSTLFGDDYNNPGQNQGFVSPLQRQSSNSIAMDTEPGLSSSNDTHNSKLSGLFINEQERIKKYRLADTDFILRYESTLPTEIKGEYIDVWWLADDGGLTMLLPELLTQNYICQGKKLRVMAVSNRYQTPEETSRLQKTEIRMINLLSKFRINAKTVGVDLNLDTPISKATKHRFEKCLGIPLSYLEPAERKKVHYHLRISEEMRRLSKQETAIVFVILPLPDIALRAKLHTVLCDMMSYEMPPMIMMRGNNESVLTFFC